MITQGLAVRLGLSDDDAAVRGAVVVSSAEDVYHRPRPTHLDATVRGRTSGYGILRRSDAGRYTVDDDEAAPRWIRTVPISVGALHAWRGLEVLGAAPSGTSLEARIWTPGGSLYHDGAAWVSAGVGEWNTVEDLEDAFADLSPVNSEIAIEIRLRTTSAEVSPVAFGALVAYDLRWRSAFDDALFSTLRPWLASNLGRVVLDYEVVLLDDGVVDLEASGFDGEALTVVGAYDTTEDPARETPLAGTLDGGVWQFDDPPPTGHRASLEVEVRVDVVVRRHARADVVGYLPALVLAPTGRAVTSATRRRYVRPTNGPSLRIPSSDGIEVSLSAEAFGAFGADVEAIAEKLSETLGDRNAAILLSARSGLPVTIRAGEGILEATDSVSGGPAQARGSLVISYSEPRSRDLVEVERFTTTTDTTENDP